MLLAEQLVGEARERRQREMGARERMFAAVSAGAFLVTALTIAVAVPSNRGLDLPVLLGLVAAYAVVSRVRFEFADAYVSAEQLVFVPMLLLLPLPYVPLLVSCAAVVAIVPDIRSGTWHWQRCITSISESWFAVGPVLVISALAPGEPRLQNVDVYALAFGAEVAADLARALVRERLLGPVPSWEFVSKFLGTARVDAILSPLAFVVTLAAVDEPLALLVIAPLVWLLAVFSRDRRERYSATLELNRAYRGTVMLLADVVEFDDRYTASHSRSVVELVQAVAEEMGVDANSRQELEFGALLHDIGKISIPKEILNKPARLTPEEFELMKTHTIEGQFMLDRVGGLLARVGEIVRSCHERWDGHGYPDGLSGQDIPLEARIVFTCDAYNAMTTNRPYRAALPSEDARAELVSNAGSQFDPDVVAALFQVIEQGEPETGTTDEMRALLAGVQMSQHGRAVSEHAAA
jgi:HD-GYP domain-containing protein (c-di-GMP phosphodiesterase class II)